MKALLQDRKHVRFTEVTTMGYKSRSWLVYSIHPGRELGAIRRDWSLKRFVFVPVMGLRRLDAKMLAEIHTHLCNADLLHKMKINKIKKSLSK